MKLPEKMLAVLTLAVSSVAILEASVSKNSPHNNSSDKIANISATETPIPSDYIDNCEACGMG